jgi:phosphatidylinositol alpha-1,6-mannosyltransferase
VSASGQVLLIANNFPPIRGGSAVVYDNLARHSGGRIVVLAPRLDYVDGLPLIGWREHDRRAPYKVVRLALLRTLMRDVPWCGPLGELLFRASDILIRLRVGISLLRLIRAERIAAVCIGELLASSWIIDLLRRFSLARRFVYVHGEEITTESAYDRGHDRARRALQRADGIIVVSRFTFNAVRGLLGATAGGNLSLIENGVDTSRFRPVGKRPDLVQAYRLQTAFVFVSVCRLLEKKGIDHAIRAFAAVVLRHRECRYLVVGAGPYEETLRRIATEAGIAHSVVFTGDVPDEELVEHYCLGDVFVLPNRKLPNGDTEGFGLVFLEANSCGVPVIAGRDGGSCDAVRHGVNGLIVDGESIEEITTAMLSLRENIVLREHLVRGGLERAAAADWRSKAEAFVQLCTGADLRAAGDVASENLISAP